MSGGNDFSPIFMPAKIVDAELARYYVTLIRFASAATNYVTEPGHWPGYVAWLEQHYPGMPAEAGSEAVRMLMQADAWRLSLMAEAAGEKWGDDDER